MLNFVLTNLIGVEFVIGDLKRLLWVTVAVELSVVGTSVVCIAIWFGDEVSHVCSGLVINDAAFKVGVIIEAVVSDL